MNIASLFDGDDDLGAMRMQHDCYEEALRAIVSTCNAFARFAHAIIGDDPEAGFPAVTIFDHRTLQGAHDLLAAAWRHRACDPQGVLALGGEEEWRTPTPADWLEWLARETRSWVDQPHLVRHVLDILGAQNSLRGYAAEDELGHALKRRFSDVPWKP